MNRYTVPANWRTWVPGADESDFPIQNLPWCTLEKEESSEMAVRIGDYILDLLPLQEAGLLPENCAIFDPEVFALEDLELRTEMRKAIAGLLHKDNGKLRDNPDLLEEVMILAEDANLTTPIPIPQFVDFYSGINHASNVGKMFRPDMPPLLPNYRELPVGYNGRASTVVLSGAEIVRPHGQTKGADDERPSFGPTKELDFELELGFFVAADLSDCRMLSHEEAEDAMLGLVLVNDWSARDLQRWEYQPLGPFLAKSFATSISPYITPMDALEPFRVKGMEQDPEPLEYLQHPGMRSYDIQLEVLIQTEKMEEPEVIATSNSKHLYWSFAQQLMHQASNGTLIEPGDLYASGTISGTEEGTYGSLLELTWRGAKPLTLSSGESRTFLEDGDTLILRGFCQGDGYRIGFGEVSGTVVSQ
jgi:fumarylacetoacetase